MKKPYIMAIILAAITITTFATFNFEQNTSSILSYSIPSIGTAEADKPRTHTIELAAIPLEPKHHHHDTPVLAYKMLSHKVMKGDVDDDDDDNGKKKTRDLTSNYPDVATIPGPTLVIKEGDLVNITIHNHLGSGCVSVHVHGIHYGIESDGTLMMINGEVDGCAEPHKPYTYTWKAGKGTAGTWPYHDHTLGTGDGGHMHPATMIMPIQNDHDGDSEFGTSMHGSSSKGLFGTLIINPKSEKVEAVIDGKEKKVPLKKIEKEIILYMIGTRFYGNEIDNSNGQQIALWENPMLVAKLNELVRFHVISLGTDSGAFHKMAGGINTEPMDHLPEEFHTFHIHGHRWLDQGTSTILDTVTMGPAESTQFVIKAGESVGIGSWMYHCHVLHHMTSGMWKIFKVTGSGGTSMPGEGWDEMMHHMPHTENT